MITLLTDFGAADYFVPAVKGVIFSIDPQAQIIDISHEIRAQDIASGAFTLGACYHNFPRGTIHLSVVDPGVGSERRAIIVVAGDYLFVGPDNGIFSYVYSRESRIKVYHITREEYFLQQVSATFHGRDLFAPVAAWLSRGICPDAIGNEIHDYFKFDIPRPEIIQASAMIEGRIIHIDRFGNCITNFTQREMPPDKSAFKLMINGHEITQSGTHFAQAINKDDLFAYPGSAGYWEIGLWCNSAAAFVGAQVGDKVITEFNKTDEN